MVMSVAILQPVGNVYITSVTPADETSSIPVVLMVATEPSVLAQVPPGVKACMLSVVPTHAEVDVTKNTAGGSTVITYLAVAPEQVPGMV